MNSGEARTPRALPSLDGQGLRHLGAIGILAALLAAPSLGAAPARANPGDADLGAYVTDGSVDAIVSAPDGSTYIGGNFSAIGPRIGSGWSSLRAPAVRRRPRCPVTRTRRRSPRWPAAASWRWSATAASSSARRPAPGSSPSPT